MEWPLTPFHQNQGSGSRPYSHVSSQNQFRRGGTGGNLSQLRLIAKQRFQRHITVGLRLYPVEWHLGRFAQSQGLVVVWIRRSRELRVTEPHSIPKNIAPVQCTFLLPPRARRDINGRYQRPSVRCLGATNSHLLHRLAITTNSS